MPGLQFVRQSARRLRDDFKATRNRIKVQLIVVEAFESMTLCETFGEVDMVKDIAERIPLGLRRHRPHLVPLAPANRASALRGRSRQRVPETSWRYNPSS